MSGSWSCRSIRSKVSGRDQRQPQCFVSGPALDGNADIDVRGRARRFNVMDVCEQDVASACPTDEPQDALGRGCRCHFTEEGNHFRWKRAMGARIKRTDIVHAAGGPFRGCESRHSQ